MLIEVISPVMEIEKEIQIYEISKYVLGVSELTL